MRSPMMPPKRGRWTGVLSDGWPLLAKVPDVVSGVPRTASARFSEAVACNSRINSRICGREVGLWNAVEPADAVAEMSHPEVAFIDADTHKTQTSNPCSRCIRFMNALTEGTRSLYCTAYPHFQLVNCGANVES
jgi:hypothetical protein